MKNISQTFQLLSIPAIGIIIMLLFDGGFPTFIGGSLVAVFGWMLMMAITSN